MPVVRGEEGGGEGREGGGGERGGDEEGGREGEGGGVERETRYTSSFWSPSDLWRSQ